MSKNIFFFSGFLIFYAYFGYILTLMLFSALKTESKIKCASKYEPKVSLLISAYNEMDVVESKILNSLSLDYNKDKLEIVIISDGSTDSTNEIVEKYLTERVVLRNYEGRIGKTACLNNAVPLAKGEIIVFSDANSKYDKSAIKELVKNFSDNQIGFVTGSTKYVSKARDDISGSVGFYSKLEKLTKILESRNGSCVGADGAIFAIRKNMYPPLKTSDINDLVIPLNIIKKGYRGILDNNVFCIENTAGSTKGEFYRQVRITTRTLRAIFQYIELINPLRYGWFSFKLVSHKMLKLIVPILIIFLFLSNLFLSTQGVVYKVILVGQITFYLLALMGYYKFNVLGLSRILSASYIFSTVNIAILWGWVKYLKGETFTTWSPTER